MHVTLALMIAVTLLLLTIFVHYEALRLISGIVESLDVPPRRRMLFVLVGIVVAHLGEILLWGLGLMVAEGIGLGRLHSDHGETFAEFFYFSAEAYTSLGLGDIQPIGSLRLLAGIEALTGLLLIAWSASFTYLMMTKLWDLHR